MRNLKRVLSLGLASVMLLGMMVIGAGAADKTYADLTDSDKITNQEAVSMMVDLGIIEGKPDGSYDPTATVDRATMAKLITMMLMGDVDQSAFEGTVTDLTDIDTSWAEGYIKYCYANGIITGDGQGHFFPTEPVTVVQAAKMLLVAIGYDAEDRGYQGDANWSTNIMRDAQTTSINNTTLRSLTKGLNVKATDPLTRDNAAQMIFNALFVRNVEPEYQYDMGTKYISKYNYTASLADTTYNGLTRYVGVLTGVDSNGYATVAAGADSIAVSNKVTGSVTEMGKAVAFYKDNDGIVSSSVVEDKDNASVAVPGDLVNDSTKAKDVNKWLTANGLALSNATTDYKVTNYSATTGTAIVVGDLVGIGNYTVAYVIDSNADGVVDALVKTTKTVSEVTGAVKTKTDSDGKVTVYVPGVTSGYVNAVGYEGLAKGDLVMSITYAGTTYITKCETVTGKITGYKGTTEIYIDGTAYTLSNGSLGGQTVAQMYALDNTAKKDVTLFLDENGNALYAKLVDSTATYNVAIVLGYDVVGSSVEDTTIATARLMMADGTIEVVNVSGGNADAIASNDTLTSSNYAVPTNYYPVAYSIDSDGNYVLTKLTTSDVSFGGSDMKYTELTDDTFTPGLAKFSGDFAGVGNNNTVFAVANYNSTTTKLSTVSTSTGIAKTPKYTGTADGVVISVNGVAALVFVVNGTQEDTSTTSNYIYIPSNVVASYDSASKLHTYAGGYVNGEETDIVSKVTLTTGSVMKVSLNDENVVVSEAANGGVSKTGVSFSNGVLTVGTSTDGTKDFYTLADDAKVFEIDNGVVTEIAASAISADKTDGVLVLGKSDMATTKVAQYVYITKADAANNGFKVQAYTVGSTGAQTNRGSEVTVSTGTGATTSTVNTSAEVTIAATTDAKVGVSLTADDGAVVTTPAEVALVNGTTAYTFVVTATSESGVAQTCTITVNFTAVTE
ncbi:S-layer homology domain-containing protein [Pseudoflavonifractor sp.]|jgi:hypothetical protein|uniref:S-layer homology domain-containing protein n=1 Tax=Pseudoflavonifractor sp. TaxID=1980281 RepID=UPI003D8A56D5